MFTSVMHTTILSISAKLAQLKQRFNLSFWCAVYNVILLTVVFVGIILSSVAGICMNGLSQFKQRFAESFCDRKQRAMNLVHIRDYFFQRR